MVPSVITGVRAGGNEKAGLEFAIKQIQELRSFGVEGIHLYPLNKKDVYINATGVLDNNLIKDSIYRAFNKKSS